MCVRSSAEVFFLSFALFLNFLPFLLAFLFPSFFGDDNYDAGSLCLFQIPYLIMTIHGSF